MCVLEDAFLLNTSTDDEMAARILRRCNALLSNDPSKRLSDAVSSGNWKAVGRIANGACRNALQLAMLELRTAGRTDIALENLQSVVSILDVHFSVPEGMTNSFHLVVPIHCCLLLHQFALARDLAGLIHEGQTFEESGGQHGAFSRAVAAALFDDSAQLDAVAGEFEAKKLEVWWQRHVIYLDIYKSLVSRRHDEFVARLADAVRAFPERASDERFGDGLSEFGGLRYNAFTIDFLSMGIACWAAPLGFHVEMDEPHFPSQLLPTPDSI